MRRTYCPTFNGFIVRFRMLIAGIALALLSMFLALPAFSQTKIIAVGAGGGGGTGTVESVNVAVPSFMQSSGGPVTESGTITLSFNTQAQGLIFASPCSGTGAVTWRSLCAADIPTLAESKISGLTSDLEAREETANKNVANGYAGLDSNGKISSSQLPSIALTDTFVVASQVAMLALPAETGDVAIRTDSHETYILAGASASTLADWELLETPTDSVTSVAGQTGAVTLTVSDISGAEATANKNASGGYAGLDGSGKVSGSQITYGSSSGTAAEGNDSRLSNARTPTAHASTHAAAGSDPVTLSESQVTNLTSDLAGKQASGNYITALTGDVVATGPGSAAATIQADSVALGPDTTGNYAGSSSEGGSATQTDALKSATTTVNVSSATAPSSGQVLTATGASAATWQTPTTGDTLPVTDTTAIAKGSSDTSKQVRFEVDGMTASNTGVITTTGTAAAFNTSVTGYSYGAAGIGLGSGSSDLIFVKDVLNSSGWVAADGTNSAARDVRAQRSAAARFFLGASWAGPYFEAGNGGAIVSNNAGSLYVPFSASTVFYFGAANTTKDTSTTRAAAGVMADGTGTEGSRDGWRISGATCFTGSDQTNASTTPQSAVCYNTGTTAITLAASANYEFQCSFYLSDSVAGEGAAIDFDGGTATATTFIAQITAFDSALALSTQTTALATDASVATFTGGGNFKVNGFITVNAAGTFQPRFFQATHSSGTLTLAKGSNCVFHRM